MSKTVPDDVMLASASESGATQPFTITSPEAASQAFLKGWPVQFVGGYITGIATDTPVTVLGIVEQDFHNLSAVGVYGVQSQQVAVAYANAINIFSANVKTTSLADYVLLQSDLGRVMGIQRDTTNNKVFLNAAVAGGANGRVFTLRPAQNTDVGDTNGRVLFIWLPLYSQSATTS